MIRKDGEKFVVKLQQVARRCGLEGRQYITVFEAFGLSL
jgi:hypothetical protein